MLDGHPLPRPPTPARKRSVLIVDRDAEIRLAARRALERSGFAVTADAQHGTHPAAHFDLVIADPGAVSLSVLHSQYPQARFLALSREGGDALAKPFTPSQLLSAVRRCLARS